MELAIGTEPQREYFSFELARAARKTPVAWWKMSGSSDAWTSVWDPLASAPPYTLTGW